MSLWQKYRQTLKPVVVEEWVDLLLYRPLGFAVAYPLSFTPVTPNQVTLLSTLAGVAGGVCIWLGKHDMMVWGALLYLFSNVLDCTDGQLARLTRKFSPFGRIFDGVADYIVGLAFFSAIGFALQPASYSNWLWWSLVLAGVALTAFQGMFLNHVREAYLNATRFSARSKEKDIETEQQQSSRKRKFFLAPFVWLYSLYLSIENGARKSVRMPKHISPASPRALALKIALVLWTFTGKGTHVTLLGIFLLMGKPEYYFWFILIPMNLWLFVAWTGHQLALKSLANNKLLSKKKG